MAHVASPLCTTVTALRVPHRRTHSSSACPPSRRQHCPLTTTGSLPPPIPIQDTFFKRLPAILPSIPPAVAIRKILPLLSSALEFGGAPAHAVGSLMVIGKQLEGDEFTKRVVPTLSKLFASPGEGIQRRLHRIHDTIQPVSNESSPLISVLLFFPSDSGLRRGLLETKDSYPPWLWPSPPSPTLLPPNPADRSLRRSLLETMDSYGPHLTTAVIEDQIYPQLQVSVLGGRGGSTSLDIRRG